VIRVSSIFSQTLQLFSGTEFERAVVEHRAEAGCWGQFVAMLFCDLGWAWSLPEICGGLAASRGGDDRAEGSAGCRVSPQDRLPGDARGCGRTLPWHLTSGQSHPRGTSYGETGVVQNQRPEERLLKLENECRP
jgi:hypothetical protein